jgi:hypothetical protein
MLERSSLLRIGFPGQILVGTEGHRGEDVCQVHGKLPQSPFAANLMAPQSDLISTLFEALGQHIAKIWSVWLGISSTFSVPSLIDSLTAVTAVPEQSFLFSSPASKFRLSPSHWLDQV